MVWKVCSKVNYVVNYAVVSVVENSHRNIPLEPSHEGFLFVCVKKFERTNARSQRLQTLPQLSHQCFWVESAFCSRTVMMMMTMHCSVRSCSLERTNSDDDYALFCQKLFLQNVFFFQKWWWGLCIVLFRNKLSTSHYMYQELLPIHVCVLYAHFLACLCTIKKNKTHYVNTPRLHRGVPPLPLYLLTKTKMFLAAVWSLFQTRTFHWMFPLRFVIKSDQQTQNTTQTFWHLNPKL